MISAEDAAFYRDQGFLLIEDLLDGSFLQALRKQVAPTINRVNAARQRENWLWRGSWISDDEREKQTLDSVHDMQFHTAAFSELLLHPPLLNAMEMLIGPNVQLHHTKLLAKPPKKGGGFPMHQDYPYFPHEKHSVLAVSIYLDDADEENGCIAVMPGSHKLGPLECDPGGLYLPPDEYPLEKGRPCPAKAGDALVFNYLTIHGSKPNRSSRPRRNILMQLRDPEDRPVKEVHLSRGQGMMLRGINPLPYQDQQEGKAEGREVRR